MWCSLSPDYYYVDIRCQDTIYIMEDNQILKSFSRVKSSLKIVLLTKLLFVFTWIHWLKSASPYSLQQSIEKSIGWNVVWKYVAKSKRNLSSFLHSSNIFSCIFSRWWLFIFKVISAICELRYRYTFQRLRSQETSLQAFVQCEHI